MTGGSLQSFSSSLILFNRLSERLLSLYNEYFTYILSGYGKLTYQTVSASFDGMSIGKAVGIYNGSFSNANTGYVASAYILGGFLWVCLYTLIFCLLMVFANVLLKSVGDKSKYLFILFS